MEKPIIALIIILLVLTALFLVGTVLFSPKNTKSLKIAYSLAEGLNDVPLIIGYEKGFFKEAGLDVELISLASGGESKQVLASGNVDIASAGIPNFFVAIAKNAPVKIVAFSSATPIHLFVRPDSNIDTFKELEGAKIACPSGGSGDLLLRYILEKEGVNTDSITLVDIEKTLRANALMKNKIVDVVVVSSGNMVEMEKAGAVLHKEWQEKGYSNAISSGEGVTQAIAVNSDFMSKNPDVIDAFIEAFIKSHYFMREHPDESAQVAAQHIAKNTEGTIIFKSEEIRKIWDTRQVIYLLWQEPDVSVELSKVAKDIGITERTLTNEEIFNLKYEQKLKDADYEIYGKN